MNSCTVVASDGRDPVFQGTVDRTVKWLEENPSEEARFVYISETADILSESEFLDLASDDDVILVTDEPVPWYLDN